MKDKKNEFETQTENEEQNKNGQPKSDTKAYFYAAIVACAMSAVAFGLAFSTLKIYSLIASVTFLLAALTLINTQKKVNNFKWVFYLSIIAYVLLGIVTLFFIGGIIYAAVV